jgi:hypothetical protein
VEPYRLRPPELLLGGIKGGSCVFAERDDSGQLAHKIRRNVHLKKGCQPCIKYVFSYLLTEQCLQLGLPNSFEKTTGSVNFRLYESSGEGAATAILTGDA